MIPVVLLAISLLMPWLAMRRTRVVTVVCHPAWQIVELESPRGTTKVDEDAIESTLPPGRHQFTATYEDAGRRYEVTEAVMLTPGGQLQVDFGSAIARDKVPTPVVYIVLVCVLTATFWRYDREKLAEANGFHKRLLDALRAQDAETARIATVEAMRVARSNALQAWDQQERLPPESIND